MSEPTYHLNLLGPCELHTRSGEVVDIPQGKPLALLAYIALAPSPPPRDELSKLLWPGVPRKRARGSLRQALWKLRTVLGEDAFTSDDPVVLRDDLLEIDIHRLRDHLQEGRLLQAVAVWKGPPMEDLDIRGVPGWERWVDGVRRELEQRFGSALSDRGNRERELQPGKSAIQWLEQAVEVQPHRLEHHLDLAEAHLESRAFDEVARALATARKRFEDPAALEDIGAVEERLLQLKRGAPAVLPEASTGLRLQFTGRTREFAALVRRWHLAREGESSVGLILGEAGIGKTRLAEEVALLARSEGARVVQVKAEDSERPIEWALLGELVRNLLPLSGAAGISAGSQDMLRSLLPSLPPTQGNGGSQGEAISAGLPRTRPSAALTDALQDLLSAVSEDAPLLVIVDDLQWADGESRSVLARAATRIRDVPLLFIITSRTGGPAVSPRIGKTLNLLARASTSLHLELGALTEDETRTLLQRTLNAPNRQEAERVIGRIIRASRGNPLFVLELMKVLRDQGILSETEDGSWTLNPEQIPQDLPLPASLRDLINQQLDQLSQSASLVAAHLARAGHPVSPRVVAARTGMSQSALTDGVAELIQRRIIHWDASDKLAFAHDELRTAVSRRYQLHVGLTTGGGTHWSLFRTAVVASLLLLLVGAAVYAARGDALPVAPPLGGGPLLLTMEGDSTVEARASAINPMGGWRTQAVTRETGATGSASALGALSLQEGGTTRLPSPDHSRIAELRRGSAGDDSVWVTRPGNELLGIRGWERIHAMSWCGDSPPSLLLSVVDGVSPGLLVWEPSGNHVYPLDVTGMPGSLLACSPDGRYAAIALATDGEMTLSLIDLGGAARHPIPLEGIYGLRSIDWVPERPHPVPTEVQIEGEVDRELDWGDRGMVRARVERDDGSFSSDGIRWISRDPGVASVTSRGRVTANRPGQTVLVASFDGWLADSLVVTVRGGDTAPPILFWDPSPPQRSDGWTRLPVPPALHMTTDEQDSDGFSPDSAKATTGWRSTQGFDLTAGGTLETELRLSPDEAPLQTCLTHLPTAQDRPEDPLQRSSQDAEPSQETGEMGNPLRFCFSLWMDPEGTIQGELHYHPAFPGLAVDLQDAGQTTGSQRHHLSLTLRADGAGIVHLDREEVARTPLRFELERPGQWHVETGGVTVAPRDDLPDPAFGSILLWPDVRF